MSDIPQYQPLCQEDHLHIYESSLSPERTVREVDGIINLLGLSRGDKILDLCCGYGRHSINLAQRGYQIVGQDLSEVFLHRAKEDAKAHDVEVQWIHKDMRDIPFKNTFDAAINMFTAFGYFENEDENQKVFQQVHKALKPGGCFLIDIIHRDALMRQYLPYVVTRNDDGSIVIYERHFDLYTSRNKVRTTVIFPDDRRAESYETVHIYTLTDLVRMFEIAGFQVQAYYGGLNGSPLTLDTLRMVVIGRKAASSQ
ncbi:MAG: class I SAM-dependent methyltransferase [Tolypothrix carrinoi HA7290-LM1]|nr:class I SAM-dependent methyltransferase [Tolypothrix carrinoi HA7290-LM1]